MARTRTFLELQDDAYLRADETGNTDRFPRSEVGRYVNQGCAEAWGIMVDVQPKNWAENATPQTLSTVGNTASYTLANTTLKVISVRLVDGTNSYTLEPFGEAHESILEDAGNFSIRPAFYQIRKQVLYVLPKPAGGLTLRVRFVPHYADMTGNSDIWDATLPGSDEYPVVYAAKMIETKNQRWDAVQALDAELMRLDAKIRAGAQRDITMGRKIQDTRGLRWHRLFTRYR